MKLKIYLQNHLSESSVKIYLFEINHYIKYVGSEKAEQASYTEVMDYINYLRQNYDNPNTIQRIIYAIKRYYFYLITIKRRSDHPCRYLSLKDQSTRQIQIQDLLKEEELEQLLGRKERYKILAIRNKVIISLLIYQALRVKEICQLKLQDIDLEKASIYIQSTPKTNARTLSLKPKQVMLFYCYLNEIRVQLSKEKQETLILTKRGTAEKGEGIHYLITTFRRKFPSRKLTPTTIRQSVIANLLAKGNDLRIVQVFAGHKKPSATEKYRQNNLEKLRASIEKYHPLQ